MTAPICLVCDKRPTPEGYACTGCSSKATGRLSSIIDLAPDARLVAASLVRHNRDPGSNKPGSRSPFNADATDKVHEVQNTITTLARDIAETRGLTVPKALGRDPIAVAAQWLMGQIEWLRHAADGAQPWAPGAYGEISECASRLRGLVSGPAAQRFLGPCGSTQREEPAEDGCPVNCTCHNGPYYACDEPGGCGSAGCGLSRIVETEPCEGDVYCHVDAEYGRCKLCGAKWPRADRQEWLDARVRSQAFRAYEIADAYRIPVNTIRSWAHRGRLLPHDHDAEDRPRYLVGDVLDLATADAVRRAEQQARRSRRKDSAA